jgi:hypothetical protein
MLNSNALSNSVNHYGKGKMDGEWSVVDCIPEENQTFTVGSGELVIASKVRNSTMSKRESMTH